MKRQTDLRNIAPSIQIYENEHGELPVVGSGEGKYFTRAGNLDGVLREYIS